MTFGAPLGLLGLLAIPSLLALYFLRRKQPPRTVSALFLWRSPDDRAEAGPKLERLSRELSLALELLAAIAATLFLADLRCGEAAHQAHTVAVVDASLSMSAKLEDGRTVFAHALDEVQKTAARDGGRITLIASGVRPRVLVGPSAPSSALSGLHATAEEPQHALSPALALARDLAGSNKRIRLYTDHKVEEPLPDTVEVVALGAPLENDAFTSAARSDQDGRAILNLRVGHFGAAAKAVPLVVSTPDGKKVWESAVQLGPGEEKVVRVELPAPGELVASLPDDALPQDGRVTLLPNARRPLKVAVHLPEGAAAQSVTRLLAADGAASLAEPGDLLFAPAAPPNTSNVVTLGASGTDDKRAVLVGPFFADLAHPLLEEVSFDGVVWAAGENPPGTPLVTSGPHVLVSEEEARGVVHLNIDLARSNLQRTAAFPILLSNVLSLRRQSLSGAARRQLALGEELALSLEAGPSWELQGPSGTVPLHGHGSVRLPPPGPPGRYRLLRDGKLADELVVAAIDPGESDLRSSGAWQKSSSSPVGIVGGESRAPKRSAIPLVLLTLLLCADWYVTAAGRKVGSPEVKRA